MWLATVAATTLWVAPLGAVADESNPSDGTETPANNDNRAKPTRTGETSEGEKPSASTPPMASSGRGLKADEDELAGLADPKNVPIAEKRVMVEKSLSEQRDALARVTVLLREATDAKDMVQRNCVDEKLTQIKGLLRISEEASVKMYEAIAGNIEDLINHEFTKIAVAHQRTKTLRAEAEQCVGESSVYSGDTDVEVDVDPDLTQDDPTKPIDMPPGPDFPPVASKY
ncbi:MAG: hypothetical protein H6729_13995 [Deltaproteobacteria bacterium]|nr:hypothetical protein [Deltaproteobacteria bacterium]